MDASSTSSSKERETERGIAKKTRAARYAKPCRALKKGNGLARVQTHIPANVKAQWSVDRRRTTFDAFIAAKLSFAARDLAMSPARLSNPLVEERQDTRRITRILLMKGGLRQMNS